MENWKSVLMVVLIFSVMVAMGMAIGCSCGDDDDDDSGGEDDDAADDDAADDDTVDDDAVDDDADDDVDHPCDDWDLVIDGETDFGAAGTSDWTAELLIDVGTGAITGVVIPEGDVENQWEVTGLRNDQTTGYIDGSFPTPLQLVPLCDQPTIYNHMDFTVIEDVFDGDASFYCGQVDEEHLIGIFPASGFVSCGDFAM
jgi:hypothetical protein